MKAGARVAVVTIACVLGGCATVRQEDLQSWEGQPVAALESHPVFLTMPVVRTTTSDGVEIRHYVNGREVTSCSGGGTVFAGSVSMATYNQFASCVRNFGACNAIFYIRNGRVESLSAVGTGGARCYSNETMRPGFRGAVNIR
jgi:hypothetical protein